LCDVIGVLSSPADVDVMIRRVLWLHDLYPDDWW
jgi:hypothetical protein